MARKFIRFIYMKQRFSMYVIWTVILSASCLHCSWLGALKIKMIIALKVTFDRYIITLTSCKVTSSRQKSTVQTLVSIML